MTEQAPVTYPTEPSVNGSEYVNKFDYNKLKDRDYKAQDYSVDPEL